VRKYVIGFVLGVLLTLPSAVFADTISNIGKRVTAEFVVVLNNKELPVKAIVIEGRSYAPVRAIAENLGLSVDFADGQVILTSEDGGAVDIDKEIEKIKGELRVINRSIENLVITIQKLEADVQFARSNDSESEKIIQSRETFLRKKQAELTDLESQKADLEAQLAELERQKAEFKETEG